MSLAENTKPNRRYLFAVLLPLIVVICVSFLTVYIAVKHADQPIANEFSKNGLTITASDEGQLLAEKMGLDVSLVCANDSSVLELLVLDSQFELPAVLQLWFVHSVDPKFDRRFIGLLDKGGRYPVPHELVELTAGYWKIFDAKNNWMLEKKELNCRPVAGPNGSLPA